MQLHQIHKFGFQLSEEMRELKRMCPSLSELRNREYFNNQYQKKFRRHKSFNRVQLDIVSIFPRNVCGFLPDCMASYFRR